MAGMREWLGRHKLWLIAMAALVLVAAVALLRMRPPEVMVAEAFEGPLTARIAASGIVETQSTDLSFQGAGRLSAINVREGDAVSRTDTLAWVDAIGSPPGTLGLADVIRAPYAGTVVEIYLRVGSVVAPGQPVMHLVAAETPWVTAFVESEDAVHLRPGQKLQCRAGGYLSEAWEVEIEAIGKEAVPRRGLMGASRQVRVRCAVSSPGFPLAPGTEVDIDGEATVVGRAVLIPTAAVIHEGPTDRVWLVEASRVHERDVKVGPNNFDHIEIRSGLQAGDTVVVHGKKDLRDGRRIKATPVPPTAMEEAE